MGYKNLSDCIRDLEQAGHLRRVDVEVDPYLEMAAIQRRAFAARGPALLFTRPRGCAFPMLANLFGTRERLEFIFRDTIDTIQKIFHTVADQSGIFRQPLQTVKMLLNMAAMRPKKYKFSRPAQVPVLASACALSDLPRLVSWPKDGGPFITLPLVYSEDPNKKNSANLGMYRIQLAGNSYASDEVGLHYQIHRGLGIHHASAIARGIPLPVHIHVGGPPALTVSAVMPLPAGVSELLFAGLLGGRRQSLAFGADFSLPVLAECDFLIQGYIHGAKPEGPFGDHLGYYSLRHDFPVLKVKKVYHRANAVWPFTSVGRPPQEDTVFGDFIHELTAPLVGKIFNGIREVHAVDAAGVHPLLLAVGSERYTPDEVCRKPREIITQAMHLLGTTQTALAKYLLIAAGEDSQCPSPRNVPAFLRHILERTDFASDLHFITRTNCDTLDYSGGSLNEGSKLIWASAGSRRRELDTVPDSFPPLPAGFCSPRVVAPGIMAIQGPPHGFPAGTSDPAIREDLCACLANWSRRDGFPLVVVADDSSFCSASLDNFLWVTFTRSDPATDTYGAFESMAAKHWSCQSPLVIDARSKRFHAPPLDEDAGIVRRVEALARKGAPLEGIF